MMSKIEVRLDFEWGLDAITVWDEYAYIGKLNEYIYDQELFKINNILNEMWSDVQDVDETGFPTLNIGKLRIVSEVMLFNVQKAKTILNNYHGKYQISVVDYITPDVNKWLNQ